MIDYEFYETPDPFTRWLFTKMAHLGRPIVGRILEPCVGNGAIPRAAALRPKEFGVDNEWVKNDLDPRWCSRPRDATETSFWREVGPVDWTVTNPHFSGALTICELALPCSRQGVALHLRASIHEVLKTGVRRTWMHNHKPSGILWLPRFAYQRSRAKGVWTTDSVCACWVIWLSASIDESTGRRINPQFIDYAPESVIDALATFTPGYRERMDALMGFTGSEGSRQNQCREYWKAFGVTQMPGDSLCLDG